MAILLFYFFTLAADPLFGNNSFLKVEPPTPKEPSCQSLALNKVDSGINLQIEAFRGALASNEPKDLISYFHPRLKFDIGKAHTIHNQISFSAGRPYSTSIYKVWKLHNPQGAIVPINCPKERLQLTSHYGHKTIYFVKYSILGKKELGRALASFIESNGKWLLASFKYKRWTHGEKHYLKWFENGTTLFSKDAIWPAYLNFYIAEKLVDFSPYLVFDDHKLIKTQIEKHYQQNLLQYLASLLTFQKLEYASPIFANDGVGILLRFRLQKDTATPELRTICQKAKEHLTKNYWKNQLAGIRCSFVLPKESSERDGALGSFFLSF